MEKKKLLIADAGEEFPMALQDYLQDFYQIRHCREGNEALQMMESFKPDVMILDVMLPGVDGVTLLQRAEKRGLHTTVMVIIRFQSDYLLDALERLNVGYVMPKPCEVSAVAVRLNDMLAEQQEKEEEVTKPDLRTLVDNALLEMSFNVISHGYSSVREALLEAIRQPNQQVTKTLYPAVGQICGGNSEQVEHAIRRMIKNAWACADREVWNRYMGNKEGTVIEKCPTNKEFIFKVAACIAAEHQAGNSRRVRIC